MGIRRYFLDILVLTTLIFLVSWVTRRTDPGWFNLQQASPWLIIPLLAGGRYGFMAGLVASLVAAASAALAQHFLTESDFRHLLNDNPAYYVALLATGAFSGLACRMRLGNSALLEEQVTELTSERDQLKANNRLYRENEALLQNALVSNRVSHLSLTKEADTILNSKSPVEESLMKLLHEKFGLRSAALYRSSTGATFKGVCTIGKEGSSFAASFQVDKAPAIARMALKTGELATCRNLWDEGENPATPQPFLAALSQKEKGSPTYLLLIRDMQFENIDWENFAKMEAMFRYVLVNSKETPELKPSSKK